MQNPIHPSGAMPLAPANGAKDSDLEDDQLVSTNSETSTRIPASNHPAADNRRESSLSASGRSASAVVNPYCECSPCKCPPPCTCGLELKSQETITQWYDELGELVHIYKQVWKPSIDRS